MTIMVILIQKMMMMTGISVRQWSETISWNFKTLSYRPWRNLHCISILAYLSSPRRSSLMPTTRIRSSSGIICVRFLAQEMNASSWNLNNYFVASKFIREIPCKSIRVKRCYPTERRLWRGENILKTRQFLHFHYRVHGRILSWIRIWGRCPGIPALNFVRVNYSGRILRLGLANTILFPQEDVSGV